VEKHKVRKRAKTYSTTHNRVAEIKENKNAKRYDYGKDNLLPNLLLKAIEASITAASCRERKQTFIEGNGFQDRDVASVVMNPKQTADDLAAEFSDYSALFNGLVLNVKYNTQGEPKRGYAIPLELTRKGTDGELYVNEKLVEGKDINKDRVYYQEFNPKETPESRMARVAKQIEEHGKQIGDLVYSFGKKAGQKEYPIPTAWAGMEEIESDAALGRLDLRNVKRGFRPDVILTTIGVLDDDKEDESGRTEQDYFDKTIEQFTGEEASSVLNIKADTKDQIPSVVTFDSEKLLNSTTEAANRIGSRVCRAMNVPEVLIPGFAKPGQLGNSQEMVNLLKMFATSIIKNQRMITRTFERVWPERDWTIDPLVIIEELPDWLLEVLTPEEKRQLGDYEPLIDSETTTAESLSILSPLVATKVLNEMSSEEIRALIGLEGAKAIQEAVQE